MKSCCLLTFWRGVPGQGIKLEPYGWVATTNAPPEEGCINNFERLQKQARAEVGIFEKLGFDDLLTKGLASHDALVSRLNKAFVNHLKSTWVPNTLKKLSEERRKLDFQNATLGMPAAHTPETRPAVKDAIVKVSLRGGGLGSRPKKMYGERLGDGVEYHLMKPTPRR